MPASRGSYTLDASRNTITPSNMNAEGSTTLPNGQSEGRLNRFRSYVGRSCCSCVEKMPAIVLVIAICLLVALLLALIPAVFVLTNAVASESQAQVSTGLEAKILRSGYTIPPIDADDLDETDDSDQDFVHGIPLSSLLPPNVSICQGFGFACTNEPHIVISTARRCDGIPDCPDRSDEFNCVECQSSFSCDMHPSVNTSTARVCLLPVHICDGLKQCPEGDDEDHCVNHDHTVCEDGELQCQSSSKGKAEVCLPGAAVCDGVADCSNGKDEVACSVCIGGSKKCATTGKCVAARKVCDGESDCPDGSDEQECDCRSCSGSDKALCGDGTCVDRWRICDGHNDCSDGMDEENCPGQCTLEKPKEPSVVCTDGREYLKSEACSGLLEQCDGACDKCDDRHAFACKDKCIPLMHVCDGHRDCAGGEDEKNCKRDATSQFKCLKGNKHVNKKQRCDGVWDCADGSDEKECDKCPKDSLRCQEDKTCHPQSSRCNGVPDCSDGSDETDCSCFECIGLHSGTYMCEESMRCFRRDEVCSPYSVCPNATRADKVFCADRAIKHMIPSN